MRLVMYGGPKVCKCVLLSLSKLFVEASRLYVRFSCGLRRMDGQRLCMCKHMMYKPIAEVCGCYGLLLGHQVAYVSACHYQQVVRTDSHWVEGHLQECA